jgi:predicted outer membrane repeat protein
MFRFLMLNHRPKDDDFYSSKKSFFSSISPSFLFSSMKSRGRSYLGICLLLGAVLCGHARADIQELIGDITQSVTVSTDSVYLIHDATFTGISATGPLITVDGIAVMRNIRFTNNVLNNNSLVVVSESGSLLISLEKPESYFEIRNTEGTASLIVLNSGSGTNAIDSGDGETLANVGYSSTNWLDSGFLQRGSIHVLGSGGSTFEILDNGSTTLVDGPGTLNIAGNLNFRFDGLVKVGNINIFEIESKKPTIFLRVSKPGSENPTPNDCRLVIQSGGKITGSPNIALEISPASANAFLEGHDDGRDYSYLQFTDEQIPPEAYDSYHPQLAKTILLGGEGRFRIGMDPGPDSNPLELLSTFPIRRERELVLSRGNIAVSDSTHTVSGLVTDRLEVSSKGILTNNGSVKFSTGETSSSGGAIHAIGGEVTFAGDIAFEGNSTSSNGGAISVEGGTVGFNGGNITFGGNSANNGELSLFMVAL